MNIPPRPVRCRVRRPSLSMSRADTRVMEEFTAPVASVAISALDSRRPAPINILVE
ncbi:hypothetical protein DPMN_127524 [Dreissena polymorpha]|uniref:Uncharacterized protein n=1 Tax=Dreissena polymorpha TaxID=45954 RepID=A0A9D4H1E0_DREPO|nr:hypothetical protein DPMN_127524 [Dreissena polymorpha]